MEGGDRGLFVVQIGLFFGPSPQELFKLLSWALPAYIDFQHIALPASPAPHSRHHCSAFSCCLLPSRLLHAEALLGAAGLQEGLAMSV